MLGVFYCISDALFGYILVTYVMQEAYVRVKLGIKKIELLSLRYLT